MKVCLRNTKVWVTTKCTSLKPKLPMASEKVEDQHQPFFHMDVKKQEAISTPEPKKPLTLIST